MIDPEDRKRWQAMAAELGLPPEEEETPPASVPVDTAEPEAKEPRTEVHEPEPAPVHEETPSRGRRRRSPPLAPEPRAEGPGESPVEAAAPGPVESGPALAEAPAAEATDASEQRPSRRRRRGRRGSKKDEGETEPASVEAALATGAEAENPTEPVAEVPDEETPEEPARRRGRRRGRSRKGERESEPAQASETEEAEEEVVSEEPARVEEEEDDEMDDLSNWNVPSWQELIASLYRPER
jgi:ribonuclease E